MLDIVRDKLREIYDRLNGKHNTILKLFIDQFGEPFVDSDIKTFDELVEFLNSKTLGTFIDSYEGRNEYGYYSIDRQDYNANGRGKPFLEYIPDLGILDYITPYISNFLGMNRERLKTIMVHFPNVRVTNEYDKFIDIQDLYASVKIKYDGRLQEYFRLARTTYPYKQFKAGYAHSHMMRVSSSDAGQWSYPCTGIGPINDTMKTLKASYNEQFWGLFTFELAKYVTVESVAGVPYIRLEEVDKGDVDKSMSNFNSQGNNILSNSVKYLINAFIQYYAEKHKFRFQFVNGQYQIGESPVSMIVNLSNEFIAFLNDYRCRVANVPTLQQLKEARVLQNYIVANGRIYQISNNGRDISAATSANGRDLFRFKGEMVKLKILFDDNIIENYSLLLAKNYCEAIITNVLSIINYQYGKRQNQSQENQVGSSQGRNQGSIQATARAGEKPCFI